MLGYSLWALLGANLATQVTLEVPLSFYNMAQNHRIDAPEQIRVTLIGSRARLRSVDTDQLAIHYDAAMLSPGKQPLALSGQHLLLPDGIRMLHYTPLNLAVFVAMKDS